MIKQLQHLLQFVNTALIDRLRSSARREALEASEPLPSKRMAMLALIRRREGASLEELAALTGWQPHTVRGTLSSLRRAGIPVVRDPEAPGTRYRIDEGA